MLLHVEEEEIELSMLLHVEEEEKRLHTMHWN